MTIASVDPSRATQHAANTSSSQGADGVFLGALTAAQRQPAATSAASASRLAGVDPMLLHDLAISEKRRRDREAQQRGKAILGALAKLQRALLAAEGPAAELDGLSALTASLPQADDPGLAALLKSIAVRAAIELSRHRPPGAKAAADL